MPAESDDTLNAARRAKNAVLKIFGRLGTVAGIGVTRVAGRYAVKVNLSSPLPAGTTLPDMVDGVPIRVEVVGAIRKR